MNRKLLVILFLLSTAFFLYQHSSALSWDFNSYTLNAKYLFSEGKYFEPLRPPLMPILLGVYSICSWFAAELIFIITSSFLFMYSSRRLARALKFDGVAFYAISLNIYVLLIGLINGTELLSLVSLELFICFLIENKPRSGLYLGLSTLARYTGLALSPLLLLHIKLKKIIISIVLFWVALLPWLIFNYVKFGNMLTSFADQYANNILFRSYMMQPMALMHFANVQNILIPFFLLGLVYVVKDVFLKIKTSKKLTGLKPQAIMFYLLLFAINSYKSIPLKDPRYLFNLVLPTLYFSYLGIQWIFKNKTRFVALGIFLISITFVFALVPTLDYETPQRYESALETLNELNISNCSVMSNAWVMLSYLGKPSEPSPREQFLNSSINDHTIVLFKHVPEPDYSKNKSFLNSFPIMYEDSQYTIIGTGECHPLREFNKTYLNEIDKVIFYQQGKHINQNPCFILFRKLPLFERGCNLVNLNGFKLDDNRHLGE